MRNKTIYSADDRISGFRISEVWMSPDTVFVSISRFYSGTDGPKQLLQETDFVCVEINTTFDSSKTISVTSCRVLK